MLNIELETRINPYSEMLKWMFIPGISVKIKENKIQIFGDIPAEEIRNISKLDIARVSNTSQTEESSFKRVKSHSVVENGRITHIKSNFNGEKTKETVSIKKGQIWLVDFGQPVGNEFGYPHPAIVLGKSSTNDCMVVIPCSSKEKSGKIYKFNFTEETLKFADTDFLEKASEKTTTVLIDQRIAVDRVRFLKYYGTLEKNLFENILRESGLSEGEIKRTIAMTTLDLTEKQRKIMEFIGRDSDIFGAANNTAFTYEQRVRALLSIFGYKVQLGGDIDFLEELIKNTRYKKEFDMKEETEFLARRKILNSQTINCKLVELTKKRFKNLHPCLIDFVLLVNKLAS